MSKSDLSTIFNILLCFLLAADLYISTRKTRKVRKEDFSTKELLEELKKREDVATEIVEPYADFTYTCNGPATVLTIFD